MNYSVKFDGFKTKKQALEFLQWYEGGGEQAFYEHLQILDMEPDNGCNVDVRRKGNKGRYYDENEDGYVASVK